MGLGTKLFLGAFAIGSWTTILTVLAVGAVYFWPVPTARSLCGDIVCIDFGKDFGGYIEEDFELKLPGYKEKGTSFVFSEYDQKEGEARLSPGGTLVHLTSRRLGPHALVGAAYVAVYNTGIYLPRLRYPTAGGEMDIEIDEDILFLTFSREIEEVPVRNEPAASAFDHHRAVD